MKYKELFPIFNDHDIHYLDNAATSQKPSRVIESISKYYSNSNGNPGRGSHKLAIESSALVEGVREKVRQFIGARKTEEIIFTKNTTEALNMIAYSFALQKLTADDEILLGISNHHANIVPWQMVAQKTGSKLQYIYLDEKGQLDLSDLRRKISNKTRIVSLSMVVNATGVIQPYEEVLLIAKEYGALTIFDAAQSIAHFHHNVEALDVDFLTFSGHKIYAAMGVGVLYGKKEHLEGMSPFLFGGDMIEYVEEQHTDFAELPHRLEAGTKDVGSIVSLGAAIDFIHEIGFEKISQHEKELLSLATEKLSGIEGVELYHNKDIDKSGVLAFNVRGVHSHDTSFILDNYGVMVRSGHHCAQPLMKHLGIPSCCRASFSIYNDEADIEALVKGLYKVKEVFSV